MWLIFALISAVSQSSLHLARKKAAIDHLDPYALTWFIRGASFLMLAPFAIVQLDQINMTPIFLISLVGAGTITSITSVLILRAYETEEVSHIAPLINFTPAFLLVTSLFMLGESPPLAGLLGVLAIVFGAYVLNTNGHKIEHLTEPFRQLFKIPAARTMLLVAFLWSFSANFDKLGVADSSPIVWVFLLNAYMLLVFTPLTAKRDTKKVLACFNHAKLLLFIALASVLALVFQMLALREGDFVSYVVAIKHLSSVFTIAAGWKLFHEHNLIARLTGGSIMVAGAFILAVI